MYQDLELRLSLGVTPRKTHNKKKCSFRLGMILASAHGSISFKFSWAQAGGRAVKKQ
jgi:hypothetical protein